MYDFTKKTFRHVCPLNCPSSCTIVSHLENQQLHTLTGDPSHPYTKGKLCAKGFALKEKNSHRNRLKFPYYQEVKGSGRFKKITWEKAYELIIDEFKKIQAHFGHFLPLAFYKGTGNRGIHHYVTDEFFSSLGCTTRLLPRSETKTSIHYMSDPASMRNASMIIVWGANPASSNIHLIPFFIEAKVKGAKLVVIDPIYTQTAEMADIYIQPLPGTDGALATAILKKLLEEDLFDSTFMEESSIIKELNKVNTDELLKKCGVVSEALDLLIQSFNHTGFIAHLIGSGVLKHCNSTQNVRAIEILAGARAAGGVFLWEQDVPIFRNQRIDLKESRAVHLDSKRELPSNWEPPIEMLWISCGNPLTQEANSGFVSRFLKDIPFVVTVDHFLTPTAQMSNLVLPSTTFFEEMDIVVNSWHGEIAINERALPPYFESQSEWKIMRDLAERLNWGNLGFNSFSLHSSEEEYLNYQFTDSVFKKYYVHSVNDLRERTFSMSMENEPLDRYRFENNVSLFVDEKRPGREYPFWLMTPHHPYRLNSQFYFLHLTEEKEANIEINPVIAKKLGIFDGEVVKVFNDLDVIEMKAKYSKRVPQHILLIYEGWDSHSKAIINRLIPSGNLYDTFVNISKL